jgi:Spy/CpxP family protein refolding chaperone
MKNQITRMTLLSALAIGLVAAQGPRGPRNGTPPSSADMVQMRVDMLTKRLTLTDAQQAQAKTIFTQAATETESVRANIKTVMDDIRTAVKKNDTGTINSQSIAYGTLSGQLMASEQKAAAAFYAILTADQKAKFDRMGPGMMGAPGMRGFGGPGGPGGPHPMRGPRPSSGQSQ